jgi:hypothetical protein
MLTPRRTDQIAANVVKLFSTLPCVAARSTVTACSALASISLRFIVALLQKNRREPWEVQPAAGLNCCLSNNPIAGIDCDPPRGRHQRWRKPRSRCLHNTGAPVIVQVPSCFFVFQVKRHCPTHPALRAFAALPARPQAEHETGVAYKPPPKG